MKAAAPLASSFVIGLGAFVSSSLLFRWSRAHFSQARYLAFCCSLAAAILLGGLGGVHLARPAYAAEGLGSERQSLVDDGPNMPMGQGRGIFPGRVVWVHNPEATNESYNGRGRLWFEEANTKQALVSAMLSEGLSRLTGQADAGRAWEALFRDFNKARGRGDQGYVPGQRIVIKINLNGTGNGPQNINTSPQVCLALLEQLCQVVGVAQSDITIGDPNIVPDSKTYAGVFKAYPEVAWWGRKGLRPKSCGFEALKASDGKTSDPLPQAYLDADYLINVPVLKKHHRAGISLCAKNHFGSITPFNGNGAFNWHYSLPAPQGGGDPSNGSYGVYRCLTDIIAHKDLGGKTILYLVDGLWGSINWGHPAIKWRLSPFNDDWPSSLFLSQDPVAIDSVGYDLLYAEFGPDNPQEGRYDPRDNSGPFARYPGADDYLHQAASPAKWPSGLSYDPEGDGQAVSGSLGVHEHWNNPLDKQYSRNLGRDVGIDLVYVH